MTVTKWRPYLQQREFIIRIDQKALMHLNDQRLTTGIQHKAFIKLLGLKFQIQYKKGAQNAAAYAFITWSAGKLEFHAISVSTPKL